MNTWEMFCAACICGVWLALTTPAPDDALGEALGIGRRVDQLGHELVVRHVGEQCRVEPTGDLLAPAVDIAGALVIIAQQIIPEGQPMLGVVAIVGQQPIHQALALVRAAFRDEGLQFLWRRQQPDHIQICAAREQRGRRLAWRLEAGARQNKAPGSGRSDWRLSAAARTAGRRGLRLTGSTRPKVTLASQGAPWSIHARSRPTCCRRQARALLRHDVVGVNALHQRDEQALARSCRAPPPGRYPPL